MIRSLRRLAAASGLRSLFLATISVLLILVVLPIVLIAART